MRVNTVVEIKYSSIIRKVTADSLKRMVLKTLNIDYIMRLNMIHFG